MIICMIETLKSNTNHKICFKQIFSLQSFTLNPRVTMSTKTFKLYAHTNILFMTSYAQEQQFPKTYSPSFYPVL